MATDHLKLLFILPVMVSCTPQKEITEPRPREIVVDLRLGPLLAKKVFIDTLAVRSLRFNTPRETSGAIDEPSEASQAIRDQVDAWAERVAIPPFSLGGLGEAINVDAINPDSLRMPEAVPRCRKR